MNTEAPLEPMQLAKLTAGELSAVMAEGTVLVVCRGRADGEVTKQLAAANVEAVFKKVSSHTAEFSVDIKARMHPRVVSEGFALTPVKCLRL